MTMNLRRRHLLGAMGATGALSAVPAWAQFRIEITGVGATQVPVAVMDLRDESAAGTALGAIVRADLVRSGLFKLVENREALDERSRPVLADWRARGADALVAGSVAKLADGRFDVRYKVWDAVRGEELLGQSQVVAAGDLRLAAHRIADAVHQHLIGEPGVFATRIAYVVQQGPQYSLLVTDADGEAAQVALKSLDPIISPAWSPDGKQLAYVSFESQKAVVWVQETASGQRRMVANFRGSNSAPAWAPDGRTLAVALSQPCDRYRAGLFARRQADLFRERPWRWPAGLSHGRERRRRRAHHLRRRLQHQPGRQPRRAHPGLCLARRRRGLQADDAGPDQWHRALADGHPRRRKPQFCPQRPPRHVRDPARRPRRADDDHARRPHQGPPADQRRGRARTGLGALWSLIWVVDLMTMIPRC
jgi:TolB amino-terminal domain/WD40-like Beta Propeller Repeat